MPRGSSPARLASLLIATTVAMSVLAAGLAAPPPSIVPGGGVDRVRLGMSETSIRSLLGAPTSVVTATGCCGRIRELDYKTLGLSISFLGGSRHVSWITTDSSRFQTEGGARVGSSKAQLLKDVAGVRCGGGDTAADVCTLHGGEANETSFELRNGIIFIVIVGLPPE